jgi:rod shape-determining protein MreD
VKAVVLFSLLAVGALLLQTTVLPQALLGGASPDLLLIVCVYLALRRHSVGGALGAFGLGYLQDAFSGSVIGLNAFGMSLVFIVIYLTSRRLWVENTVSRVVAVFLASVVKTAAILVLVALFMSVEGLGSTILSYLLTDALLAAALSPAVFAVLSRTQLLTVTEEEA